MLSATLNANPRTIIKTNRSQILVPATGNDRTMTMSDLFEKISLKGLMETTIKVNPKDLSDDQIRDIYESGSDDGLTAEAYGISLDMVKAIKDGSHQRSPLYSPNSRTH